MQYNIIFFLFVEESIQKSLNIIENETILINSPELVISNIELRTGDTVFCTHFEDFNHLYLCKGSKNNTIPDNYSVIINSEKRNGNYNIVLEII